MTKLEMLQDLACQNCINIYEFYHESNIKGCCMTQNGVSGILINKSNINGTPEETCVLAEELGHIETGAHLPIEDYLNPEFKKWLKRKNEILAKRWAFDKIASPDEIVQSLNSGHLCIKEIADELHLAPDFVSQAMEYYKNKGLVE